MTRIKNLGVGDEIHRKIERGLKTSQRYKKSKIGLNSVGAIFSPLCRVCVSTTKPFRAPWLIDVPLTRYF